MSEWKPIEYDSYDGSPVGVKQALVCADSAAASLARRRPVAVAWWDHQFGVWVSGEVYPQRLWFEPKFWMPIPELPS